MSTKVNINNNESSPIPRKIIFSSNNKTSGLTELEPRKIVFGIDKTIPTEIISINNECKTDYQMGYPPNIKHLSKEEYGTWITVFNVMVIVVILVILSILIWLVVRYHNRNNIIPPPVENPVYTPYPVDLNVGSLEKNLTNVYNQKGLTQIPINSCTGDNVIWNNNKCECAFPFFGPYCDRQIHDPNYIGLGLTDDPASLLFTTENANQTINLTYNFANVPTEGILKTNGIIQINQESCTMECTNRSDCKGIVYDGLNCKLITSDVTVGQGVNLESLITLEPTIYLNKMRTHLRFTDRVFMYSVNKPTRYWIRRAEIIPSPDDLRGFVSLDVMQLKTLKWFPERIVNDGGLYGIWSTKPFSSLGEIVNHDEIYIDKGDPTSSDYKLNLPDYIINNLDNIVYVVYVPSSMVPEIKTKYTISN
jgi:hypothetical protein